MTAKHFGIMECAFFNRHGYAGVGPAYVDVGKEGVEWGLKGGRSFSLRQSCNTHTHTRVPKRDGVRSGGLAFRWSMLVCFKQSHICARASICVHSLNVTENYICSCAIDVCE